jgi:hypothetical protein
LRRSWITPPQETSSADLLCRSAALPPITMKSRGLWEAGARCLTLRLSSSGVRETQTLNRVSAPAPGCRPLFSAGQWLAGVGQALPLRRYSRLSARSAVLMLGRYGQCDLSRG